jgi:murein DD-endopeptidase MepM/ murein hydrolase activator NlpD
LALDFSLARVSPNIAQGVEDSFQAGRERGRVSARDAVLANYGNDPEGTANALMGIEPATGIQLATVNRQNAAQDAQLARQQSEDQRAAHARGSAVVAAVLSHALQIRDPDPNRQAQLRRQFLTDTAAQMGQLNPEAAPILQQEAANVGVDDATLQGHVTALSGEPAGYTLGNTRYNGFNNPVASEPGAPTVVHTGPDETTTVIPRPATPIPGRDGAASPQIAAPPAQDAPTAAPGAPTTTRTPVSFQAPLSGPVTSGFGHRERPTAGATTDHHGIDYGVPVGSVVTAAADGVVIPTPAGQGGLGNSVWIRHSDGSTSIYGHLSSATVHPGTHVERGQAIGESGRTGTVTGPNLHFEILDPSGHPVNPATLLHPQARTPGPPAPPAAAPAQGGQTTNPDGTITIHGAPRPDGHYGTAQENASHGFPNHAVVYYPPHGAPQRLDRESDHPPANDTPILGDEDLTFAAGVYMQTGQMPAVGQGRQGAALRQQILHRAAQVAHDTGQTGAEAATLWAENRTAYQTLAHVRSRRALIEQQAGEANSTADLVLQAMPDGQNGTQPWLNRPYRAFLAQTGNAGVTRFNNAVNTFAEGYARVMTGAMGSAAASDSARAVAHRLLNADQSPAQIRANIAQMRREMAAQTRSLDQAEAAARAQIRQAGGGSRAPATAPAAAPTGMPPGVRILRVR